jgi:hypothetical protein
MTAWTCLRDGGILKGLLSLLIAGEAAVRAGHGREEEEQRSRKERTKRAACDLQL